MRFSLDQPVHFVGVGGFGMSAIARVMLQQGYTVTGSDRAENALTRQLAAAGARVFIGHAAGQIGAAQAVIISSAVQPDNPEVRAAHERGVPVLKRSEMLAALLDGRQTLAVAGTHGKTTTSAMLAHILRATGHDPSYIVGGVLANTGDNARHGVGRAFVIEADEYDNMFHGLRPYVALVTSLEYDHPDFFPTYDAMIASFEAFVRQLDPDGRLIVCAEGDARRLAAVSPAPVVTYGLSGGEWRARDLRYAGDEMRFDVCHGDDPAAEAVVRVYGQHNALNALGAALAAAAYGLPLRDGLAALATFRGTGRRFEVKGEADGVIVIDDYAHHPTAIATTIEAARQRYPEHTLWAVWQPHTFSRTLELRDEYARAFDRAHHALVTDIFPAREAFTDRVHSRDVVARMQHPDARATGDLHATAQALIAEVTAPAVILIMSAGDAPQIGEQFLAARGGL
ncbi:UDP-N-acetylmuramate--L-alanine ligase [Aggregatilineales bacterium SYSU G02658]